MECGVINGDIKPGSTVAIIGAGPVGLSALLTARLYTPSSIVCIDVDEERLNHAKRLGADKTLNSRAPDAMETLDSMNGGRGFDSVIEAVGIPETFELCQKLVAPGGSIANIGVHGQTVNLYLENLWDHNISE
jgi:alcohol dehydrogenase